MDILISLSVATVLVIAMLFFVSKSKSKSDEDLTAQAKNTAQELGLTAIITNGLDFPKEVTPFAISAALSGRIFYYLKGKYKNNDVISLPFIYRRGPAYIRTGHPYLLTYLQAQPNSNPYLLMLSKKEFGIVERSEIAGYKTKIKDINSEQFNVFTNSEDEIASTKDLYSKLTTSKHFSNLLAMDPIVIEVLGNQYLAIFDQKGKDYDRSQTHRDHLDVITELISDLE